MRRLCGKAKRTFQNKILRKSQNGWEKMNDVLRTSLSATLCPCVRGTLRLNTTSSFRFVLASTHNHPPKKCTVIFLFCTHHLYSYTQWKVHTSPSIIFLHGDQSQKHNFIWHFQLAWFSSCPFFHQSAYDLKTVDSDKGGTESITFNRREQKKHDKGNTFKTTSKRACSSTTKIL